MSAVTPDSTIRLLKCPIKLDDHNQITFATVTAQTNYFLSLSYLEDENLTYIRKDGVIRVGTAYVTYEDLLEYNYVMYQNTHYDNKWFYAYITNIEYKNDGMTEISIDTDVYQTWMFEMSFKYSFIEREHVNDDTIGKNTVPENIEHGEYIENSVNHNGFGDTIYLLAATTKSNGSNIDGTSKRYGTNVNGIPYSGFVYAFDNPSGLGALVEAYADGGFTDNIYAVWTASRYSIEGNIPNGQYSDDSAVQVLQYNVTKPTTINGYTPKNKKVLCFPYRYLLHSNNNGQADILHYEGWSNATTCTFDTYYSATIGGDSKDVPYNYYGVTSNQEHAIVGGKYPTLSWSKDLFTNWLSQNAVNIGIGQATSVLSIVAGAGLLVTGAGTTAGIGLIAGGIGGIANSMMTQYQHSFDPTSARGNTNVSGLNIASNESGYYYYHMSIKSEYAQMIDNYFTTYGYKVNRIGTPHLHVRTYWDFCKTIDCHIAGNIPERDCGKLRELFNSGCTFWHDTSHFMDYTQNNTIIT